MPYGSRYGVTIELNNAAKGGMTSAYGITVVHELVSNTRPDLVVIAFGMNDASARISPGQFGANIQRMIDDIRASRADTDIILVAPMLPNPRWRNGEIHGPTYQCFATLRRVLVQRWSI